MLRTGLCDKQTMPIRVLEAHKIKAMHIKGSTNLAFKARAMMPAANGAAADVPVCPSVQESPVSVVA